MSTTIRSFGGLPDGFGVLGRFFGLSLTFAASALIAAVAATGFGAEASAVVVSAVVVDDPAGASSLGIAEVFVPPPHAASASGRAMSRAVVRCLGRFTAGNLSHARTIHPRRPNI